MSNTTTNGGGKVFTPHDSKSYRPYKVFYESNLTKFSLLDNNRNINKNHVNMLVVSIRKKGQLMPIVVNEDKEVIEGQHRLKACEELGIPIAYVIMQQTSSKDIAMINNSQKSWGTNDYLKHFSHSSHNNNAPYRKFSEFKEQYPLSFTLCLMLLMGHTNSTGTTEHQTFKLGKFKIKDWATACKNAGHLIELKGLAPNLLDRRKFCVSFLKICRLNNFSFETYLKQVDKYQSKFIRCNNVEDWVSTSIEVYNFRLLKAQRITNKVEGF